MADTHEYRCVHTGPIDLDDGRVLAPGETAEIESGSNKVHRDEGRLTLVNEPDKKVRK